MLLRLLAATATLGALVGIGMSPAMADSHCHEERIANPVTKEVTIRLICNPDEDGGDGDTGGGVGHGGGSGMTCTQTYWPPRTEPLSDAPVTGGPDPWWRDIEHRGGGIWGEGHFNCSDGSERSWWLCYAGDCSGEPGPDGAARVDGLLAEATARVDPPLPGLRHSFDQPAHDGEVRAIVKAETWWWAEDTLDPVVVREDDPPVWVEVTATPAEMTIDPGDRTGAFICPGPGLAWDFGRSYYDQVPGEPRGACVHVYEALFDSVTATMTVAWTVTYEGFAPGLGNVSGTLAPIVREQQVSFPVKEIQSHIVTGEGG